jgi:hypothetical protein
VPRLVPAPHNEIYREQTAWTAKHEEWIAHRHFADPAARSAFSFYRAAVAERDVTLSAITAELAPYFDKAPFAEPGHSLAAYRAIDSADGSGVRLVGQIQ